jgi:hypothetical protein
MREADWNRLLTMMRDGMVVPVVGARLLLDADGTTSLQARVAAKLLADNGVPMPAGGLPPFREVNEAVTLLKGTVELNDLYCDIDIAMRALRKQGLQIPQPLQQLAQISDFRLIVTLTPDDTLSQALQGAGRPVNEVVHSPKLSTGEGSDLPADWQRSGGDVQLLYLFGKSRQGPLFAIHDEDALEYAHNVIARGSHAPTSFLGALQDRNLLLIGCNFPDWLSRFMLRATRKGRLNEQGRTWLVEPLGQTDPFIGFLDRYSPSTAVLSNIDPSAFVAELHRRWLADHVPVSETTPLPQGAETPEAAMFFISYSRTTDLPAAVQLHDALVALGVAENEIWFDRQTLEPGDRFRNRILDGIRSCRYFLPVISQAATQREEAFVFLEWKEATARHAMVNRDYLLPLIVDPENRPETYQQASVKDWFNEGLNFGHAPAGAPDPMATKKLQALVRQARTKVA